MKRKHEKFLPKSMGLLSSRSVVISLLLASVLLMSCSSLSISQSPVEEKSLNELVDEFSFLNPDFDLPSGASLSELQRIKQIASGYKVRTFSIQSVMNTFDDRVVINQRNIKPKILAAVEEEDFHLVIALLLKNVELCFGYEPRDTQLLSVLLFINKEESVGRLLQINTGEGKSVIIGLLAAYLSLTTSLPVDVVTSGYTLAKRDIETFRRFYSFIGLSTAHNVEFFQTYHAKLAESHDTLSAPPHNVYTADILYGTPSQFEGDMLRDFTFDTTLTKREKAIIIIDEVDNMMVDSSNFITKLSGTANGFDVLSPIRLYIWGQVTAVVLANNGLKTPGMNEVLATQTAELVLDGTTFPLSDFYRGLALEMIESWVDNAVTAQTGYSLDVDYIISDGKVIIIDDSTGEMRLKTRWHNGLHEFLELKHNLPIGRDSFTAVYYSNHRFFTDYSTVYGLTGTLGSTWSRNFLSTVYSLDSLIVPTFMPSQFIELPAVVVTDDDWSFAVRDKIIEVTSVNRPVLSILESISDVKTVRTLLDDHNKNLEPEERLHIVEYLYSDSEELSTALNEIGSDTVVLATNLAGRGTDISISEEINSNGGLFVLLGFMPKNIRIERQAFGRTSRQGQEGSGMMLIRNKFMGHALPLSMSIADMKLIRDEIEKETMEVSALREIAVIKVKDEMFKQVSAYIVANPSLRENKAMMEGIKEQFGVFYARLSINNQGITADKQMSMFEEFFNTMKHNLQTGQISHNPIHYFMSADSLFHNKQGGEAAMKELDKSTSICGNKTYGFYLRKAMFQNNQRDFEGARESVEKAGDQFKAAMVSDIVHTEMLKSTSHANNANTAINMPMKFLEMDEIPSEGLDEGTLEDLLFNAEDFNSEDKAHQHTAKQHMEIPEHAEEQGDGAPSEASASREEDWLEVTEEDFEEETHSTGPEAFDGDEEWTEIAGIESNIEDSGLKDLRTDSTTGKKKHSRTTGNKSPDYLDNFMTDVDKNPLILAKQKDMNDHSAQFEKTANDILRVIHENEQKPEEHRSDLVIRQDAQHKSEIPDPRIIRNKPKPRKKKRGFWGYVLGAVQIITGACLVVFSGGILANFGMDTIMNGIDMIKLNYEMNKSGTYNNKDIFKKFIADTARSFQSAGFSTSGMLKDVLPDSYGKVIDGLQGYSTVAPSQKLTQTVLKQSANEFLQQRGASGKNADMPQGHMGDILNKEVTRSVGRATGNSTENMTMAEKESEAQRLMQQWYETFDDQLEAISPEKIEAFWEKLDGVVEAHLGMYRRSLQKNSDFSLSAFTATCAAQQDPMKCEQVTHQSFLNNELLKHPHVHETSVISFADWDSLHELRLEAALNSQMRNTLLDLQRRVGSKFTLKSDFVRWLTNMKKHSEARVKSLSSRQKASKQEIHEYKVNNVGYGPFIKEVSDKLNDDITKHNLQVKSYGRFVNQLNAISLNAHQSIAKELLEYCIQQKKGGLLPTKVKEILQRHIALPEKSSENYKNDETFEKSRERSIVDFLTEEIVEEHSAEDSPMRHIMDKMEESSDLITEEMRPFIEQSLLRHMKRTLEPSAAQ